MLLYFHCISGAPELWMWGAIASSCWLIDWLIENSYTLFQGSESRHPSLPQEYVKSYEPVHSLRSSNMDLLTVRRTATTFGLRRLPVAGPRICNWLPCDSTIHFCLWSPSWRHTTSANRQINSTFLPSRLQLRLRTKTVCAKPNCDNW